LLDSLLQEKTMWLSCIRATGSLRNGAGGLRVGAGSRCLRQYSRLSGRRPEEASSGRRLQDEHQAASLARDVASINTRLESLSLTAKHFSGASLLNSQPCTIQLPSQRIFKIETPLPSVTTRKTFIQEVKTEIKDPKQTSRIQEPITKRIKKHAIRMVILRRKKMRKHQYKRLWDRMYLKFKANKVARRKRREIDFRGRLAGKINEARKFNAEEFVKAYLEDFNTPLIPGTYKGKRLPKWLIVELMEQDIQKEKDRQMEGKFYTTKEMIVKPNETVEQFIQRTWK